MRNGAFSVTLWAKMREGNNLTRKEKGYVTEAFVTEIDETLASFDKGAFDPILMAQDVPERIDVGASDVAGDQATVTWSFPVNRH